MSVYIDPLAVWTDPTPASHLWADDEDELMEFAEKIGLSPAWAQRVHGVLFFWVYGSMRARAIQAGAHDLGWAEAVKRWVGARKERTCIAIS